MSDIPHLTYKSVLQHVCENCPKMIGKTRKSSGNPTLFTKKSSSLNATRNRRKSIAVPEKPGFDFTIQEKTPSLSKKTAVRRKSLSFVETTFKTHSDQPETNAESGKKRRGIKSKNDDFTETPYKKEAVETRERSMNAEFVESSSEQLFQNTTNKKSTKNKRKATTELKEEKQAKQESKPNRKRSKSSIAPDSNTSSFSLDLDAENIAKAIEGLIKFRTSNPKLKNVLLDDDFPLFLQLNTIKIPSNEHPRIIRLPITHSLFDKDSDICLIVPDVKGLKKKELERQQEHYEELLLKHGIKNIKKIMTLYELKTEYETFELKQRLVDLYDCFLVDGRISGKVVNLCGKIFYKKRKIPTAVQMGVPKLQSHFENRLSKTPLYYHTNGDSLTVQFGTSKMNCQSLVQNVLDVCKGLEAKLPGGLVNLRSINVYTHRGINIPIYTTLKNKNDVVLEKRIVKKSEPVTGELTTILDAMVTVHSTGEVDVDAPKTEDETDKRVDKKAKFGKQKVEDGLEVKPEGKKFKVEGTKLGNKIKVEGKKQETKKIKVEGKKHGDKIKVGGKKVRGKAERKTKKTLFL